MNSLLTNFLKSNIKDYITNDSLDPVMQKPNIYYDIDIFLESLLELDLPKEISELVKNINRIGIIFFIVFLS